MSPNIGESSSCESNDVLTNEADDGTKNSVSTGRVDPFKHYMFGMGFVVYWDIVEWIHGSDIPKKHMEGPEHKVFRDWMRWACHETSRFNAKWFMYNYPDPPSGCSHNLWNDILLHFICGRIRRSGFRLSPISTTPML